MEIKLRARQYIMGRIAWKPTKKELKFIRDMAARGATQKAIYEGLGVSKKTWGKYKAQEPDLDVLNTPVKSHISNQSIPSIKKALEEGTDARLEKIKANCLDSLDRLTRAHTVKEVKRTRRKNFQDAGAGDIIDTTTTRKVIEPNPTVVMFTSVNLMPERFQSINKVEVKQENHNNSPVETSYELVD